MIRRGKKQMIYNSLEYVKHDIEYQMKLRKLYMNFCRNLPDGRLMSNKSGDKLYYYKNINGKRSYLGDGENNEVQLLQKKYFLTKALKRIDDNLKVMARLVKEYKSIDPNQMIDSFSRAYQSLPQACFDMAGAVDIKRWGREKYIKKDMYSESLKHKTSKGELVRSKSEVTIANMLTAKGIEYHYEEALDFPDVTLVPDFKVAVKSENRFKLLEHIGLLNDEKYTDHFIWKFNKYLENGILPWRDIVFTFDDVDGNIDAMEINKIIDTFFI